MKCFVHLGRYGDIINTLPLLKFEAEREGAPMPLVVAKDYVQLLEGVSYVQPVVFDGKMPELNRAIAWAKTKYNEVINLQVYGKGYHQERRCNSFVVEQWRNGGRYCQWGLPLDFDRRDADREAKLFASLDNGKPMLLVAVHGFSSPFVYDTSLLQELREKFSATCNIVDLSKVNAHRVYDLLGVFDKAACLVTIDTMHMHLAHGSAVPVVALATDTPTMWHGAEQRAEHAFYCRYNQFPLMRPRIMKTIADIVKGRLVVPSRIFHIYSKPADPTPDQLRRNTNALLSWHREQTAAWVDFPIDSAELVRTAKDVGDKRDLPFVRDMIQSAVNRSRTADDILVLSNTDVAITNGITSEIVSAVEQHGAFFTHRFDFDGPMTIVRRDEFRLGKWYPGSDVFGFSVRWWKTYGDQYPDMILGAEFVDAVLRQLIKFNGGTELHRCVYHERHTSQWQLQPRNKANLHNKRLAAAWFKKHGNDDLDPFGDKEAERIRRNRKR